MAKPLCFEPLSELLALDNGLWPVLWTQPSGAAFPLASAPMKSQEVFPILKAPLRLSIWNDGLCGIPAHPSQDSPCCSLASILIYCILRFPLERSQTAPVALPVTNGQDNPAGRAQQGWDRWPPAHELLALENGPLFSSRCPEGGEGGGQTTAPETTLLP